MKCLIKEKLSEHKYKDNNGYLICVDSVLARTGKQKYLRSEIFADAADDDSEIEVDRKPEEVFSDKTLASFENCPLCVEHPDEDVHPDNYKEYAVGFVRDVHKGNVDGQDVILGTLVITDAQTIEEVENGQHTDLSCGYDCDIEDSANPQQRNIRGNHVALCEQGRAGNARIVDTAEKVKDSKYKVGQKWKGTNGAIITLVRYDGIKPVVRNNLDPFSEQRFANDFDLEEDLLKFNNYKMIDSVKDDYYTIGGYAGKYDPMAQKDIQKASRYGVDGRIERDGDGWQLVLHGSKENLIKCLENYFGLDTSGLKDSVKDEQNFYKGFVFDYHQGTAPIFYGFDKEKEVQKIKDDYIVYAKNHGHGEVYQYVEGNNEGFTVIIEPGKITMTRLKKFAYLQSELIKAAKEIENTNNIVFDSIKDVEPRQGESKEDFIARFMHETKNEYPDEKQRLAVAYSYWEKKDMKDSLNFDRIAECDWCGKRGKVAITHYGTTHYNRLICEECAKEMKVNDSVKDSYVIQSQFDKNIYYYPEDRFKSGIDGAMRFNSYQEAERMAKNITKISNWKELVNIVTDSVKDEETTAEEVTKDLEKDFENFKESRMKDRVPDEIVRKYQDKVDYAIKSFGRIGGGLYDELDDNGLYVDERSGKYIVKRQIEDSIKDSTYVIRYKDVYHNERHEEDIKANSIEEAIDELKKRVVLRGTGTADVYVERIEEKETNKYYPRAYGKLNSLTLDSGKLKEVKDSLVNIIKVTKVIKKYGK